MLYDINIHRDGITERHYKLTAEEICEKIKKSDGKQEGNGKSVAIFIYGPGVGGGDK